jgi:hypothetical protein
VRYVPGEGTREHLWRTLTLRRLHEINLSFALHPPVEWFIAAYFKWDAPVRMAGEGGPAELPEPSPLYD